MRILDGIYFTLTFLALAVFLAFSVYVATSFPLLLWLIMLCQVYLLVVVANGTWLNNLVGILKIWNSSLNERRSLISIYGTIEQNFRRIPASMLAFVGACFALSVANAFMLFLVRAWHLPVSSWLIAMLGTSDDVFGWIWVFLLFLAKFFDDLLKAIFNVSETPLLAFMSNAKKALDLELDLTASGFDGFAAISAKILVGIALSVFTGVLSTLIVRRWFSSK